MNAFKAYESFLYNKKEITLADVLELLRMKVKQEIIDKYNHRIAD